MSEFNPHPHTEAFANAEAFLAKGRRSKNERKVANNTTLVRTGLDSIAVVLHATAVVTYHRDGTQTIYGGGWNSVTTKQRINAFSAGWPHSDGNGSWIVGFTGETTPPRVQKCRSCKHRGRWMEDDRCHGPRSWGGTWCGGGRQQYRLPIGDDGWYESRYEQPCLHGRMDGHATEPCEHGEWKGHVTGQSERTCYRCTGTGMTDYGSRAIPVTVTAGQPYLVDAAGTFLHLQDHRPSIYPMPCPILAAKNLQAAQALAKEQAKEQVFHKGGEIVGVLAQFVPDLYKKVKHPITGAQTPISEVIVSLNDKHRWSRERIADWLDTLDADLRFTSAA